MAERDICSHLRGKIKKHLAAIKALKDDLAVYVGTIDSQESDSEEIKQKISEHRSAIEQLNMGLESQGCNKKPEK